uniref:EF-hand domain-containing protein n=1 Tax=Mantoniella antarctica TaxID=81844 RepID=A0A7S0X3G0_9CHLO|mmetsp:Transcript_13755/g.33134  ORF Transcript_13755/g.33134 Transcript_13755/m.33134 type:complete len:257 (+) Transcript_13755:171-941(+)
MAIAQEAAAARRAALANKKHAKFKTKEHGSITAQCARIKKASDNPLLVLQKFRLYYSSLRDLRQVFDLVDDNGDGVLQADELENQFSEGNRGRGGDASSSLGRSSMGRDSGGGHARGRTSMVAGAGAMYGQMFKRRGKREMTFKDVLTVMYPQATKHEVEEMDAVMRPVTPEVVVQVDEEKMKDVTDLFKLMDEDGSGELDIVEFREVLRQMGIDDVEEQDAFFYEIDDDGGGTVSLEEFQEWWFNVGGAGEVDGD